MSKFQKGDRVVLLRGCKGLSTGATGTVLRATQMVRLSGGPVDPYWRVQWDIDCIETGKSSREHKDTTLELYSKRVPPKPATPRLSGMAKRLELLQSEDIQANLGNLSEFGNKLKDIADASRRLRSLQNSVRHVALYKGPELNLYLTIKGKDVHLVKEIDGELTETLSVPLFVYAKMLESLKSGCK